MVLRLPISVNIQQCEIMPVILEELNRGESIALSYYNYVCEKLSGRWVFVVFFTLKLWLDGFSTIFSITLVKFYMSNYEINWGLSTCFGVWKKLCLFGHQERFYIFHIKFGSK